MKNNKISEIEWDDNQAQPHDLDISLEALKNGDVELVYVRPLGTIWEVTGEPKKKGEIPPGRFAPALLPFSLPSGLAVIYVTAGKEHKEGHYIYNSNRFTEMAMMANLGMERTQ